MSAVASPAPPCLVCFDDEEPTHSLPCGHALCADCWNAYLLSRLSKYGGFHATCPGPQCKRLVTKSFISRVATTRTRTALAQASTRHRKRMHQLYERQQLRAERDCRTYRKGYPGQRDNLSACKNIEFYRNQRVSRPQGARIDDIHTLWWGDYARLERHHGYIQWLFPIREHGMNMQAQPLQPHEAKAIRLEPKCKARAVQSYRLMLDFYGMQLADPNTGEIKRNPDNWEAQYANLNRYSHNYLRITRILKFLGEVGLAHYQAPFLRHTLTEIFEHAQLSNCEESACSYWVAVVRDDTQREALKAFIARKRSGEDSDDDDDDSDDDDEKLESNAE